MESELVLEPMIGSCAVAQPGRLGRIALRFPLDVKKFLAIVDQAIVSATSFATAVIIGRSTSPDQLGAYYLTLGIVFVVLGLQYQLIVAPYSVYSRRRNGRELDEYAASTWAHHFTLTALVVACMLLAVPIAWMFGMRDISSSAGALAVALPLLLAREGIRRFAFANLKLVSPILVDSLVAVVQLSGLAMLSYFGLVTLWTIYGVMSGACALAVSAWYAFERPRLQFRRQRFLADWRHNWNFSRWAVRTFLLTNMTDYALLWIVGLMVGVAVAGVLGACVTLVGMSNVFVMGVNNILTAQSAHAFAQNGRNELVRVLLGAAALMMAAMGTLCLAAVVAGDWLPVFVYGEQYENCGMVVILLALTRLIDSLGIVAANGLWAIEQPRLNFAADVWCLVATAIGVAVLVYPYGAEGAAVALLIGALTSTSVRTLALARTLNAIKPIAPAAQIDREAHSCLPEGPLNLTPLT